MLFEVVVAGVVRRKVLPNMRCIGIHVRFRIEYPSVIYDIFMLRQFIFIVGRIVVRDGAPAIGCERIDVVVEPVQRHQRIECSVVFYD